MASSEKTWKTAPAVDPEVVSKFAEVHPVLVQLLYSRGLETQEGIDEYFNPDYGADVLDPFLFTRMQDVCDRIFKALEGDDLIMVHGDYDADGICGSAVILNALKEVCERGGFKAFDENRVQWYLPDREGDGYGMSPNTVEAFNEQGVNLIITVDCGIANTSEIARAYELGMEVIVVDHHQLPDVVSDKAMIIHPLAPGESYPFKKLAAVGVAFKVATGLYAAARARGIDVPEGWEKWLLDLVSIATVTDMVPLIGENRTLETYGLVVLNKTSRVGLKALMDASGLKPGRLTTTDIGFRIGPRINAAGRVAKADVALELLLEENPRKAAALAEKLNDLNKERQSLTTKAVKRAMDTLTGEPPAFVAVIDNETRIGIAGLVAGKLVRQTGSPSVVMTKVGEHYVGSGRAPAGFHFVEAMDTCRDKMIAGGGHPEACGFKLAPEHVDGWIEAMNKFAEERGEAPTGALLDIDMELDLGRVDWELVELLDKMEPFGMKNHKPTFASRNVQVIAAETVGKTGTHLRLTVATEDRIIRQSIGFGFGEWAQKLVLGDNIDVAFEVGINEWNGNREIQLELKDIKRV